MTDCPGRPNLPQSDILAGFAQSPSRQSGHCYQPAYHHGRTRQGLTLASCDWRFLGPEQGRRRSTPKQAHSANLSRSTSHSVAHCTLFLVVSPPSVVVLGLPAPCRLLDGSLLEVQTPKANMDCLSSLPLPRIHLGCMCAVRILLWVRYMRVDRDRSLRGGLCSPFFALPSHFPWSSSALGCFEAHRREHQQQGVFLADGNSAWSFSLILQCRLPIWAYWTRPWSLDNLQCLFVQTASPDLYSG